MVYGWDGSEWQSVGEKLLGEYENDWFRGAQISGDGTTLAGGSHSNDDHAKDAGHARVFRNSELFSYIEDDSTHSGSTRGVDLISDAFGALEAISFAIEQVSGQRAEYGALQNRLEYTVSNLMNVSEFTTTARSRIEDADFAAESARLAKAQVLQQTGTAMLAQANSSSQLVLSLIR